MSTTININEPILHKIGAIADRHGTDVFVVGGYVRDFLLQKARTDIDCTVLGDALHFAQIVANEFNTKSVVFEKFRTAMVPIGHTQIEFVGTRKEEYSEGSRKPITSEGTLEDDIRRRDFTVNAMAASICKQSNLYEFGEVIDLFGGIAHLSEQILKTPLDPLVTFADDPLRMMRAARFATQLGFQIEQASLDAIKQMADKINIVSKERIKDEFMKIMASPQPSIGLNLLFETGLLAHIFPELHETAGIEQTTDIGGQIFQHKDVFQHTLIVVDNVAKLTEDITLRLSALFHDIAKPRTKRYIEGSGWHFYGHEERGAKMLEPIFHKMKLPLDNIEYIKKIIRLHLRPMQLVDGDVTDSAVRRLAANAGETLEDLFLLCRCDITSKNPNLTKKYLNNYDIVAQKVIDVQAKDKLRQFQSPVRGQEIMEICNIMPSKAVGIIKSNIENAILDGIIDNDYDIAKEYFLKNKDKWLAENANFLHPNDN